MNYSENQQSQTFHNADHIKELPSISSAEKVFLSYSIIKAIYGIA